MRKEYDFSSGKRAKDIPHLAKLQADNAGKERITIRLDREVMSWFREKTKGGGNYQTLINEALRSHIAAAQNDGGLDKLLEKALRKVVREEVKKLAA